MFPTGRKWEAVAGQAARPHYLVCNADESEPGTFKDRVVLEGDPFAVVEAMTIAALATGCEQGYIYLRGEYPVARARLQAAIAAARAGGLLGPDVAGRGLRFDIDLRIGAGAYICGEETAIFNSIEGFRGEPRNKPPFPVQAGLFGKPTIINNVLSFAAVPYILAEGGKAYENYGMGRSRGTLPFQLAGNIKQGGLVEKAFGITLGQLINDFGGGTATGKPLRAVQVGGPLGAYLPASKLNLQMDYEAFAADGAMVGHGGVVVFDDSVDMAAQARFAMEFCAIESCGKCTPCRIGSIRGAEVIDKIVAGIDRDANLELLDDLCQTMIDGSLCALGGLTPMPVQSAIKYFPEDFDRPVRHAAE